MVIMVRIAIFISAVGVVLSISTWHLQAQKNRRQIQHIYMVSVDGMVPETYVRPDKYGLKVPFLREMVRSGVWSDGVEPVMPAVTYPSHTTLVTGVVPGTHGIVTNDAWDPLEINQGGQRWYAHDIRVPTLWQAAHAAGLRTAITWWPVTVGADSDFLIPEFWRANDSEDLKLIQALSTPRALSEIAGAFPDFNEHMTPAEDQGKEIATDTAISDIACYAIESRRPNLLLAHFWDVDDQQHEYGLFSPQAVSTIENADRQIARLADAAKKSGTWEETVLVVVSDHGFANVHHAIRPGVLLAQRHLITFSAEGHVSSWKAVMVSNSGSAYIYVNDPNDETTRRTLVSVFRTLAAEPDSGITHFADHNEIVSLGGDPHAFLSIEAADDFEIEPGYSGELYGRSSMVATHGYFPDRQAMRSSFIAYGPPIGSAKVDHVRLIDIAPTIAHWLGIALDSAQGKPVEVPLRSP